MTNQLSPSDIRTAEVYEAERDGERRHQTDVKRHRRVHLGDALSLVFENRETVRGVVEEVLRAERIRDEERIAAEVTAFNRIVPEPGELSASLYLEVSDPALLPLRGRELAGVEACVALECGGERVVATSESIQVEGAEAAVHHLRFELGDRMRAAWCGGEAVTARVDHPAYSVEVTLTAEQHEALIPDLR